MIKILSIFALLTVALAYHRPSPMLANEGEKVVMDITSTPVEFITRKLKNGQEQRWHVSGAHKNSWVDSTGKPIPSSNYEFKAPGTIIIKKMAKSDCGVYDYIPLVKSTQPPAHHTDIALIGYDLQLF